MKNNIKLLDCTLRDGGLGLEDIYKTNPLEQGFKDSSITNVVKHYSKSNIDIIELGSIEITQDDRTQFAIYKNIEVISKKKPQIHSASQMYAALYRGPDTPIDDIPNWNNELCDVVRVILRYSELQKSLDFCKALAKKGYKVFIQPMLTMRYTEKEIDKIISEANSMNAFALYFVDSYGYMNALDIDRIFNQYNVKLNSSISIGFHAHNNINLAYSNVMHFLNICGDRDVIIDSCSIGMGQGAGNLQTELIVPYLNQKFGKNYNFDEVLDVCDEIEQYTPVSKWGYSVTRMIPAINHTAYKYSLALRNIYHLSFVQINKILSEIPEELRHRYTKENTELLLKLNNISVG